MRVEGGDTAAYFSVYDIVPMDMTAQEWRGSQAETSRSPPMIQIFGCSSVRLTNAFLRAMRRFNSARVYKVGCTLRPNVRDATSRAEYSSA